MHRLLRRGKSEVAHPILTKLNDSLNPLSYFLQTSMLSTDTESKEDEGKQPVSCPPTMIGDQLTRAESNDNNGP